MPETLLSRLAISTRQRRKVVPFSRGYHKRSLWRKGGPTDPRRLRPRRGVVWIIATVLLVGLVGPGLDAVSLAWRSSDGCRVWMVVDGDTVRALCNSEGPVTVRFLGFDTPETRGECLAETVRAYAVTYRLRSTLWTAGEANLWLSGRQDRYGRALGRLSLDGRDMTGVLVAADLERPNGGGRRAGWCGA